MRLIKKLAEDINGIDCAEVYKEEFLGTNNEPDYDAIFEKMKETINENKKNIYSETYGMYIYNCYDIDLTGYLVCDIQLFNNLQCQQPLVDYFFYKGIGFAYSLSGKLTLKWEDK
jgi:hypothetical protein